MTRLHVYVFLIFCPTIAWGQIRFTKLVLKPKEIYEIKESDILVVDELIMMDSSKIILNKLKPDNFIHAKSATFGKGCVIDGVGIPGLKGRNGRTGLSIVSPCTDGGPGTVGTEGTNGGAGTNLSLYLFDIAVNGTLIIDVSGGNAGDGGNGGSGGGGGPGLRLCKGGNGGSGGAGSNGGNGGNSGSVTFNASRIPELRTMLGVRIIVRNYGGDLGLGGEGGASGLAGLSTLGNNKMDGSRGRKGTKGKSGLPGKPGAINFQDR